MNKQVTEEEWRGARLALRMPGAQVNLIGRAHPGAEVSRANSGREPQTQPPQGGAACRAPASDPAELALSRREANHGVARPTDRDDVLVPCMVLDESGKPIWGQAQALGRKTAKKPVRAVASPVPAHCVSEQRPRQVLTPQYLKMCIQKIAP